MTEKNIPEDANGKPTPAQKRNRWLTVTSLVGSSVTIAAVRLATAQEAPPNPAGGLRPPVVPATQPVAEMGKPRAPLVPATQPVSIRGDLRAPVTQPAPTTQDTP